MDTLNTHKFKLFMLPLRSPEAAWRERYSQAYALWERVWLGVHQRFQVPGHFFMDAFFRHDEAASIFDGDTCVALLLFRTFDFSLVNFRRDSYFKEFTDLDLQRLLSAGPRTFAATNLTVAPEYRAFHPDVRFKQVVMNIMVHRFLQSPADTIINVARRDRDLNKEALGLGGIMLRENVDFFSGREKVDLVYYTRDSVHLTEQPTLLRFANILWEQRTDWQTGISSGKAA